MATIRKGLQRNSDYTFTTTGALFAWAGRESARNGSADARIRHVQDRDLADLAILADNSCHHNPWRSAYLFCSTGTSGHSRMAARRRQNLSDSSEELFCTGGHCNIFIAI
jgi:hypothetical protein